MPTYGRYNLTLTRGEGAYVYADNGRRYLDFGAGIAVTALGHCHPKLVAALTDQAQKLWHVSNLYHIPEQTALADMLVAHSFADSVFFANSGAEANECAIKMARKYHHAHGHPEKTRVIVISNAFHGRTIATVSAGGQHKHMDGFGPMLDGFDHVAFGNMNETRNAFTAETAAIMVEPIQGESGINTTNARYFQDLREFCDEVGILLIYDEVQTGIGRTGHLFAHQTITETLCADDASAYCAPDILTSAKGLGGGFPIGACLATEEAAIGMTAGSHGSTFGGNPLACRVAKAVLDEILADGFLSTVQARAQTLQAGLAALQAKYPAQIKDVRGMGLMIGLELHPSTLNSDVIAQCTEKGLLLVPAGNNVVRFLPPLIITDAHISEALTILETALDAISA
jgi:acetylornithine/N-succinyldiaminopimelate aminotransferase